MTEQKRNAERLPLPVPFEATAGTLPVRVVEISLIGCRIEHEERLPIGGALQLRFTWRGKEIVVPARVARMEVRALSAKGAKYESGLKFASNTGEAPAVLQSLVSSYVEESPKPVPDPFVRAPFLRYDDEEELSRPYVECSLIGGKWHRRYVSRPKQPVEGFTTIIPSDEKELDLLCRTYEMADPETRRLIRLSLELAMTKATQPAGGER
ncbi:MAG TPA: PilZ domain-containing protein [Thermoanaerobaculia bacterium]|nr:PilZ domain-containing protein [Thermoanaerobaculia bacterium]